MFLGQFRQFSLMFGELRGGLFPVLAPLVPESGDAVDEEDVEFLVGFLVDVGQLGDGAT